MNVKELLSLKGKIILVSGGSGKYGKCIVEGAAEADGMVIIASRNRSVIQETAADFRSRGLNVDAHELDQSDPNSVFTLKKWIIEKYGRLDVFVNNAVVRPMKDFDSDMREFAESMDVNATGMMNLLREMIYLIEKNEQGGSVINIGSMMGMFGPDLSNYEGTDMGSPPPDYFFHNGGLLNLTRYLTKILSGKNIRVNAVSPGGLFNNQPKRFLENYCKKVPLGRMANKDDIKGLIVLLASDAGAYINGENILMDGGLNA